MQLLHILAGYSLASIALATPLHVNPRQNASSPCAAVSASAAAQSAAATPTVPAQLAYECITSVPLNKSAALALVEAVVPYFRWQSNTAYLKDPPAEYVEKVQDAVDIWGGLDDIKSKLGSDEYANEFEFGWALYRLLQTTHDGHFVFIPDVVGTVFNWARSVPLVSVSEDGKALPKPYVYPDVLAASLGNASFTPSAITTINGQNATEYLENWSQYGSLQDRDALYNNVFYELAVVSLGSSGSGMGTFSGGGRGRWVYPGPTTELVFENGTIATLTNYAKVLIPFDGITDGESLYRLWFTADKPTETGAPSPSNSSTPTASSTPTVSATPAPGYPPPVIRESHNLIGGYYLEGDYSDVAVLSVPSFVSLDSAEIPFQETGEKFLAAARAAGKTKLIIDVSANGGGTILQGYDLFKQLFPSIEAYSAADRFRAFESTNLLGEKFSEVAEGLPRTLETNNETLFELQADVVSSVFNYQTDTDVDGKNFPNWEAKYGPLHQYGDNYTNLFRWNLSDVLTPLNSGGIYVHGYGNLTNYTQPFKAENVVVVTDGYCASTCTIFSELMRQKAGVKYISLGGRPRTGITQAIGGVKGTNNFPWTYIQYLAQFTIQNLSTIAEAAEYNNTELGEYWSDIPFDRQAIGSSINVNFRDGIRDGDEENIPLQFVYEPADCRILYTKEMTVDVSTIWKAVADSTWGGESHCIAGDLGSGYGKREAPREKGWSEKVLERRMQEWKRGLNVKDYPLDVFTDLRKSNLKGDGIMLP
ncbi:peptidase S41 family protein-like protein [Zopfia rhizophila CBS 207.26]|uniref:Peptidase S41 family protein-like protein n=1 Tax=Zopfia rhizophila CBS 207.26 TaxID=1314779 RepID=A0A6A6ENV5_9PEZI|nr:peptidase S41 family protein-like protein [Zopfia rhizophila CBS 207.26]